MLINFFPGPLWSFKEGDFVRKITEFPKELPAADPSEGFVRKEYTIQVITPFFGGGVEAGNIDPAMPIRPSSIRGHLRFWWRATRGAGYANADEMRQREGEIWGSMEHPSAVNLDVHIDQADTPSPCAVYESGGGRNRLRWNQPFSGPDNPLPYVLFPFQGKDPDSRDGKDPSDMIRMARFSVRLTYPDSERMKDYRDIYNSQRKQENERRNKENQRKQNGTAQQRGEPLPLLPLLTENDDDIQREVEAAVWAWVNFGGIGARTRRGCGALFCSDLAPPSWDGLARWYSEALEKYQLNCPVTLPWPTLPEKFLIKNVPNNDAIACWMASVRIMKEFRQGQPIGRDPRPGGGPRPSRSRWPEAESLRTMVYGGGIRPGGIKPTDHRMQGITAFPRVEFGMPIILEIRGPENIKPTLQPSDTHDRMASPLLLRPLRFSDTTTVAMIVRLNTPELKSAWLKPGGSVNRARSITTSEIRDPRLATYRDSPMKGRSIHGSAVEAFVTFAEHDQGFTKVPS